jgi:hypothetical protein
MKLCMVFLLGMIGAWAQEAATTPPPGQTEKPKRYVQRVVEIKYADVRQLADLATIPGGPTIRYNEHFRTISMYGTEESVTEAEGLIKHYDTPHAPAHVTGRNIELVMYMLAASPKGTAGEAVPPDLDPVVKQLKALFGYNDFRLLDSSVLRNREGENGEASGNATFANTGQPPAPVALYTIRYQKATVNASDKGNVIRIDNLRFSVRMPVLGSGGNWSYSDIGFATNLDIREGQKVVVGKAKYDGSDNAFILVVTAKPVD